MKSAINFNRSYNTYNTKNQYNKNLSFGAAKDISLEYIKKYRLYLVPERMKKEIEAALKRKEDITLKELHERVYGPLLSCTTLQEAQEMFPEFKVVQEASKVVQKPSKNIKAVAAQVPLADLSLHLLKERWGNLKTLTEIAEDFGLKAKNTIVWLLDIVKIPDTGKNYQKLVQASDEVGNALIASKTKAYIAANMAEFAEHNRKVSQNPKVKEYNKIIAQEAWNRLPEAREALREVSMTTNGRERFSVFWSKFPEYAKAWAQMKKNIAQELKISNKDIK